MQPKMIIVIGLPGSGKTEYMKKLLGEGEISAFYDDFQAKAVEHDKNPRLSRYYSALVADLRQEHTVAVSDIRYCVQTELNLLIAAIIDAVSEVTLEFRYFKNDPEKCIANIRKRDRDNTERELELIKEYSPNYNVPSHSVSMLEVYS